MTSALEEKEVVCNCGNTILMDKKADWCTKCGKRVFYFEKDRKMNKVHTAYMWIVVLGVGTFLTYVFLELIVTPVLNMK